MTGEGRVARSSKWMVTVHAPTVNGRPAAITPNEFDAMACITDLHDRARGTFDKLVASLGGSNAASFETVKLIPHHIP